MIGMLKTFIFRSSIGNKKNITYKYERLRKQLMLSIFIGYAGYYFVRKNFVLAVPYLLKEGFSTAQMGIAMSAMSASYGISKFLMGIVSDKNNPKVFLSLGIILSSIVNILIPCTSSFKFILLFIVLNGWFQGMGWPACGKTIAHWFSDGERGTKMCTWNISHNLASGIIAPVALFGMILFGNWKGIFYFPAAIAILIGIVCFVFMKNDPVSCGLPPIEEYKNDYYSFAKVENGENELSVKEILFKYVLNNKYLWCLAFANIFVYIVRYSILDWCAVYLTTVKGFSQDLTNWFYFFYEYAGIPGVIFAGKLSDITFKGRRGPVSTMSMLLVTLAVMVYWMNPAGNYIVDIMALFITGLLIYIPVTLIGVAAIDIVPKKAAGTAAGFTGLFGYLFGTTFGGAVVGKSIQYYGWTAFFMIIVSSCILGILFLSFTWNVHNRNKYMENEYLEEI
ncbi:phosphoglycerate transporter protein PgtP [Clostridium sp. JNZ X4-2]